jgi:hypothetical protein
MKYDKKNQLSRKKRLTTTQLNCKANRKLKQLKIDKDIRGCELCSTQATTNAHRHPRDWYKGKDPSLLWSYNQVLFLCVKCHQKLDDRSQTSEKQKEQIFNRLRNNTNT